jgi:DNA-binding MarR family transcriptional regulator
MVLQNLSDDERAVLQALTLEPLQARTLAKRLRLAQSTLFRCLVALEDAGLISVETDDDPLRRHVTLTPTGQTFKAAL